MGQRIEIKGIETIDDVVIVTTDRSLTSQDGEGYDALADAEEGDSFAAELASRLFAADEAIERVYIASNMLVVKRSGGWDDAAIAGLSDIVGGLFVFYPSP